MPKRRETSIKRRRKQLGLTQEAVAAAAGMSTGNLSLIENGHQNYTQETLESLAGALKCKPEDLLSGNFENPSEILSVWTNATPSERRQIVDVANALVRGKKDS
jgi:transcriptional regulator with XRE-family HTH domain